MAAVVLALAVALTIVLLLRRRPLRDVQAWRENTAGGLDAAMVVTELILTVGGVMGDPAHWQAVHGQAEDAARALERAASNAPSSEPTAAAQRGADALRAAVFAVESDPPARREPGSDGGRAGAGRHGAQGALL